MNSLVDCSALTLLAENLQLVAAQLSTGETTRTPDPDFSLDEFWDSFINYSKALSAETTKLCLGFTQAPLPGQDEQNYFTGRMQQMVLGLVSTFYSLPKSYGLVLRKLTRLCLFHAVSALQTLLESIVTSGIQGKSLEELQSTAEFWACCDNLATAPRTNAAALHLAVKQEYAMVTDAFNEIKKAKESETETLSNQFANALNLQNNPDQSNEDAWNERDLKVLSAAIALIKTANFVLKKVGPPLKKQEMSAIEKIPTLDDLSELVKKVSPAVDDLVLVLYAPINYDNVKMEIKTVHQVVRDLLQKCKDMSFCTETEQNWISFLSDAADHNKKKTLDLIQNDQ